MNGHQDGRQRRIQALDLVERLGGHPARHVGLDPTDDGDGFGWLLLALLLAATRREERAAAAWRAMDVRGWARSAHALAAAEVDEVAQILEGAELSHPQRVAPRLVRTAAALIEHHEASLAGLAAADSLEELSLTLSRLAPGIGAATVRRFLAPLRGRWPIVADLPPARTTVAASVHLGWIDRDAPPEDAIAALARHATGTQPADLEAALERLGGRACLRERPDRCPLAATCPARSRVASGEAHE
jgi:hypothetical protein